MKKIPCLITLFSLFVLAQGAPAFADQEREDQQTQDRNAARCLSEEFEGCVSSKRFEEDCEGKQGCVLRKCREHAKETCGTI